MNGNTWFFWALASAFFAALTAIFAKAGLQGIDSDFATFIRTLVILAALRNRSKNCKKYNFKK